MAKDVRKIFMFQLREQDNFAVEGIGHLDFFLCSQSDHINFFDGNDLASLLLITSFVDSAKAAFTNSSEKFDNGLR